MVVASLRETSHSSHFPMGRSAERPACQIFAAAALVLLTFQNLPLKETPLGGFGSAAAMPFIGFFLVFWATDNLAAARRAKLPWVTLALLIYICAVTVFGVVYFGFAYRGVGLVTKAAMAGLQFAFFVGAFMAACHVPKAWISPLISITLVFNLLGAIFIRGDHEISFSSEPSQFGVLTVLLALAHYHFCENRPWRVLLTGAAITVALFSGSKGAIAALALSLVAILIIRHHKSRGFYIIWLPVILASGGAAMVIVARMLATDIENFTSVATRGTGFLSALLISIKYPFGVGLGGFYPAFSTAVPHAWDVLTAAMGSKLNLGELFKFAYGDDRNLSSKTLFGDLLIIGGWPMLLLLLLGYYKLLKTTLVCKSHRSIALSAAVCFAFTASATYYVGIPHYVLPMIMGLVWQEARYA